MKFSNFPFILFLVLCLFGCRNASSPPVRITITILSSNLQDEKKICVEDKCNIWDAVEAAGGISKHKRIRYAYVIRRTNGEFEKIKVYPEDWKSFSIGNEDLIWIIERKF